MPQRLRLFDVQQSRFPRVMGLCQGDLPAIAERLNASQQSLLYAKEASNESWNGTYAEIAFEISQDNPTVTLPREIARIEMATVCDSPIPVENAFVQYLLFGNGRLRKNRRCSPNFTQSVSRNNAVLFTDMTNPPQYIRMYIQDERDVAKRVLLQGKDSNDKTVYSTDNLLEVTGIFVALDQPFVTSPLLFNEIQGVQKDVTYAPVEFYQVDATTGDEILILTMQPGETTASYRRYHFSGVPCGCCPDPGDTSAPVQVTAIAKLDLIPVSVPTDYCLIQNLEALIHEGQSLKYAEADTGAAKAMAQNSHIQAVRLLIGELGHWNGVDSPAVGYAPFGSARLEKVRISMV